MFGWIIAFLRGLWALARGAKVDVGHGLRPGSGASALFLFLFFVFFLIGGLLLALGFGLDQVDLWLDRHQGWFDRIGTIAFKALWLAVLLACLLVVAAGLHGRLRALRRWARGRAPAPAGPRDAEGFGWGAMLLALALGYFAAVGLFM